MLSVDHLAQIVLIRQVRHDSIGGRLVDEGALIVVSEDPVRRAAFGEAAVLIAASPGPPAPTDVVLLCEPSDIGDVLGSALVIGDTVDDVPLVHVDWRVPFVPERDDPFREVVLMPVGIELDVGVLSSIAARAVLRDPALVKAVAFVGARVSMNILVEDVLVGVEVVEGVDDVVHIQVNVISEQVHLVVAARANDDWGLVVDRSDGLSTFLVEVVDDLGADTLVSRLAQDLPGGNVVVALVALDDVLPGSPELFTELHAFRV